MLLGKAVCRKYGLDENLMVNTYKLTGAAGLSPVIFTHDDSSIKHGHRHDRLETDKSRYRNQKVIFLIRDPRDVIVSCYFQATKRIHKYKGSISDFIRSDHYGITKLLNFYNIWHENRHVPEAFLLLRYEEMQADPFHALKTALDFIGIQDVKKEIIENAVSFSSFNNMKKMERAGRFQENKMKPGNADDTESYKIRKGKIGGHTDYLNEEDIKYLNSKISVLLSDTYGFYFTGTPKHAGEMFSG